LLSLDGTIREGESGRGAFAVVETIDVSTLFGTQPIVVTVVFVVKVGFVAVLALETLVSGGTVAWLARVGVASSAIGAKEIVIGIGAKLGGRMLAVLPGIEIVSVGRGGAVAMKFLSGDSLRIGEFGFHAGSSMIASISTAVFRGCFAEWTSKVVGAKALHVVVNFVLGPEVVHGFVFGWIADTDDTKSVVLAVQSTVWDSPGLEFAVPAFPAFGAIARIGIIGWKLRIAFATIDTKVFAIGIAEFFKGRLAVLANIMSSIAASHSIDAVAKELIVPVLVLHARNTFAAVITFVPFVTRFVLAIAEKARPTVGTGAVHTISIGDGGIAQGKLVGSQISRAQGTRSIGRTSQVTFLR